MKDFLTAAKLLLLDLASTFLFLILFLLTHNTILSVCLAGPLLERSERSSLVRAATKSAQEL